MLLEFTPQTQFLPFFNHLIDNLSPFLLGRKATRNDFRLIKKLGIRR